MTMSIIPLKSIVFDAGTQIRVELDQHLVGEYAEAMTEGAHFPPIVLFHDGNRHYLADGFHRFMAAQRLKFADIDADVRPGTKDDALWFALGANKKNGKRLNSTDLQHAIRLAFETWPDKSAHEIAAQVGCTQQWVSARRAQVTTTCHLPDRVTGRDGKSYPATRPVKQTPTTNGMSAKASRSAAYEAKVAAAAEGASAGVMRKLQRRSDADIMTSAMQTLDGILGALESVDAVTLNTDPRAGHWRATIAATIQALRTLNRNLERKSA